jgi:hypothetical protein
MPDKLHISKDQTSLDVKNTKWSFYCGQMGCL